MGSHSSSSTTITRPALTDETIPLTSLRDCVRESEFDLNPETMHAFDFPRSGSSSSGTEEQDGGGRERTFGIRVTCEEVATKKTIFFFLLGCYVLRSKRCDCTALGLECNVPRIIWSVRVQLASAVDEASTAALKKEMI